jgi:hypothetical protein
MILSQELLLSDDQAITADAASTNYIDLGEAGTPHGAVGPLGNDVGPGEPVPIEVMVTEDFNNLTSMAVQLQIDSDSAFGTAETVYSETILQADLVVGKNIAMMYLPEGTDKRYLRVNYEVTGTAPTTGKVTAGISGGRQTNQ